MECLIGFKNRKMKRPKSVYKRLEIEAKFVKKKINYDTEYVENGNDVPVKGNYVCKNNCETCDYRKGIEDDIEIQWLEDTS